MADNLKKEVRSRIMASIKSENTVPEIRMRKLLKPLHFTYQPKGIYGRPDFANREGRVVVFIDGCFWHGCGRHFSMPTTNAVFWKAKIARNKNRDRTVSRRLREEGWIVIRIWEHQLKQREISPGVLNSLLFHRVT